MIQGKLNNEFDKIPNLLKQEVMGTLAREQSAIFFNDAPRLFLALAYANLNRKDEALKVLSHVQDKQQKNEILSGYFFNPPDLVNLDANASKLRKSDAADSLNSNSVQNQTNDRIGLILAFLFTAIFVVGVLYIFWHKRN